MNTSIRHMVRLFGLPLLLAVLLTQACSNENAPATPSDPQTGGADTSPPAPVVDAALAFADGNAVLTWTAPSDDDRVAAYDIRYSYSFPLHWELSLRADDPPPPKAPGMPETYTITNPLRGRDLFAAIRSIDSGGNVSPTSSIAQVRTPGYTVEVACVVAVTDEPIAGLAVTITSRHVYEHVTDGSGRAAQEDLTAGTVNIAVRPGTTGVLYHHINDPFTMTGDSVRPYKMVPYQPTVLGVFESTLQMFKAAAAISPQRPVFKKWHSLPVPLYIPPYVNANGLDYDVICRQAAQRWEERTGIDLWQFVSQPPDTGVVFFFKTRAQMGIHVGVTVHVNGPDGYPVGDEVSVVDDYGAEGPLYKTMLHELGHTIRFNHLPSGYLMYGGQPLPGDVTDDEVLVTRLYTSIPNGINLYIYDDDAPERAVRSVGSGAGGEQAGGE